MSARLLRRRLQLPKLGEARVLARLLAERAEREERHETIIYEAFARLADYDTRLPVNSEAEFRARIGRPNNNQSRYWRDIERRLTMIETENIEIVEATVKVEDGASITLDEATSRQLYSLAWERFEKALVSANELFSRTPDEGQRFHFDRVNRLLWEVDDLKRNIDVIYSMTAFEEELEFADNEGGDT